MTFFQQVYRIVKRIPVGRVTTYGDIAKILGMRDSRKVGWALHANRSPQIPCYRVVNKDGRLAPGYAFGGPNEQKSKLLLEGIIFIDEKHVDLKKHFWEGVIDGGHLF